MTDTPAPVLVSEIPHNVAHALRSAGYAEVQLPGGLVWWRAPSGSVAPWAEHVGALLSELDQRRAAAKQPAAKHFLKTSEFWMAAATLLGLAGGATSVLAGWGVGLQEPYREMVAGALALAAVWVPRAYTFARARAKAIADAEQQALGGPNVP